eukprot:TRINITY_DN12542_c0_g1_i1.p1 TRINITY_DN12542_c0_g1~~TRINITY_DN12542_c0_g1_i1.p1  ORF type:complete len:246 (-),score=114.78 TRINITY_DN12542_c0_g1_i1:151-888(-)
MDVMDQVSARMSNVIEGTKSKGSQQLDWALLGAVADGDVDGIIDALSNGADVNHHATGGGTPLMLAVSGGHSEAVDILLLYGANKELLNEFGQRAYEVAKESGQQGLAQRLQWEDGTECTPRLKEQPGEMDSLEAEPLREQVLEKLKDDVAQLTINLQNARNQVAQVEKMVAVAEGRKAALEQQAAGLEEQCMQDEQLCDQASEAALEMKDELDQVLAQKEKLEQEKQLLELQREQLTLEAQAAQ